VIHDYKASYQSPAWLIHTFRQRLSLRIRPPLALAEFERRTNTLAFEENFNLAEALAPDPIADLQATVMLGRWLYEDGVGQRRGRSFQPTTGHFARPAGPLNLRIDPKRPSR
jgi:hypothetical protein